MRIALATCATLPAWEVDDAPLHAALAARGVDLAHPAWDDPAVDWAAFDGCLIRTTWDYTQRREAFVAWARRVGAAIPLLNPPAVVAWNTHKAYLRALEAAGIPVVETVWLSAGGGADLPALVAERGWRRGFFKPAVGATSRRTCRFEAAGPELAAAADELARAVREEDMLVQPYLPAVETAGERSVLAIDGAIVGGLRKIPVPGDYRVQDDFGASDEPAEPTAEERRITRRAIDAARAATGADLLYARADFLAGEDGSPRLIELELVEPSLFLRHLPAAADGLADALLRRLDATS